LLNEITNEACLEGFKIGKMIHRAGITPEGMNGLSVPAQCSECHSSKAKVAWLEGIEGDEPASYLFKGDEILLSPKAFCHQFQSTEVCRVGF
jgi:hypothetical protein